MADIKKYFGNAIVTSPDSLAGTKSVQGDDKKKIRDLTNKRNKSKSVGSCSLIKCGKNQLTKEKISPTSLKLQIKANMESVISQDRNHKRSHRSRRRKQAPTQDIVDISEGISDSLTIISDVSKSDIDDTVLGNTRKRNEHCSESKQPVNKILKSKDVNTTFNEEAVKMDRLDINPSKSVNAFQFMMDSRNKSIGTNSPGKERVEETSPKDDIKKVIMAERKTRLQEWADKKGGQKRKLDEELYDQHLKGTLSKRKKTFKEMLTGQCSSKKNYSFEEKSHQRKEQQQKMEISTQEEENKKVIKKARKENKTFTNLLNDSEKSNLCEKTVQNLNLTSTTDSNYNMHVDQSNNFLMNLSSPIKKKDNLFSYFGKIDTNTSNTSEKSEMLLSDEEYDVPNNKIIKVKFTPTQNIKKKSIDLDLEDNNGCKVAVESPECRNKETSERENNALFNTPKANKRRLNSDCKTTPSSTWKIQFKSTPRNDDSDEQTVSLIDDICTDGKNTEVIDVLDSSNSSSDSDTPVINFIRRKSNRIKTIKSANETKATVSNVSPIKIVNIRSPKIKCVRSPKVIQDYSHTNLFKSPKSSKTKLGESCKGTKLAPLFLKNMKPLIDETALKAKELFLKSGVPEEVRKIIIRQRNLEELECDIFPAISHVQQKALLDSKENNTFNVWHLPIEGLDFLKFRSDDNSCLSPITKSCMRVGLFTSCVKKEGVNNLRDVYSLEKQHLDYKEILRAIKRNYSNFPVYKVFRQLKQRHIQKPMEALTFTNKISGNAEFQDREINKKPSNKIKKKRKNHLKSKTESIQSNDKKSIILDDSVEIIEPAFVVDETKSLLWTEMYSPNNSNEFLGNFALINTLKTWLIQWRDFDMIQKNNKTNYESDCSYNSELDFVDSNDSSVQGNRNRGPKNTAVLLGPVGSGKTTAVYSLANELGFTILEVNASSKRSGKALLTKLQEATQSHRVRAKSEGGFLSQPLESFKGNSSKKIKNRNMRLKSESSIKLLSQSSLVSNDNDSRGCEDKNLSLILVEDVNIVFEQDEGFISALSQIVQTSKRPIIFTSSEENSPYVQKFMNNLVIRSHSVNPNIFSTWLQLLCLTKNVLVENKILYNIINFYQGDIRKVLMQMQFWILSGGDSENFEENHLTCTTECHTSNSTDHLRTSKQNTFDALNFEESKNRISLLRSQRTNSSDSNLPSDDNSNLSLSEDIPLSMDNHKSDHTNTPKDSSARYHTSLYQNLLLEINFSPELCSANLDNLWFNIPDIIGQQIKATYELQESDAEALDVNNKTSIHTKLSNTLSDIAKLYETITSADLIYTKLNRGKDIGQRTYNNVFGVEKYLINNCYESHKNTLAEIKALRPDCTDRRYRQDIDSYFKVFSDATSDLIVQNRTTVKEKLLGPSIYKRSVSLDYMPALRNISRSEKCRSEISVKRNNRFYHYLRTLNINCSNKILDIACNSLSH